MNVAIVVVVLLALWLGCYMLVYAGRNKTMRLTGLGLVVYSVGLAVRLLALSPPLPTTDLLRVSLVLGVLAPAFWVGAAAHLLPQATPWRERLLALWRYVILPLAAFDVGIGIGTPWLIRPDGSVGPGFWLHVGIVVIASIDALIAVVLARRALAGAYRWLLVVVSILFGLSASAAALAHPASASVWWSAAVGADLLLLGFLVAHLDAFLTGERLGPHLLRSAVGALLPTAFVGLQFALFSAVTDASATVMPISLAVLGTVVVMQTAGGAIGRRLLRRLPGDSTIGRERALLSATADRLDRRSLAASGGDLEVARDEFDRLVRSALSDLTDLPRLATSPLLDTPLVSQDPDLTSLERARALRRRLVTAIGKLRPEGPSGFSSRPQYRHFNALHYPYVVGLRPYTRSGPPASGADLPEDAVQALAWLRSDVPERTLYNWQTAASMLISASLWEEMHA